MLGPIWTIKMQTVLYMRRLILYFHICKSTIVCQNHHALFPSKWCHIRITYRPINNVWCKSKRCSTVWLTQNSLWRLFFKRAEMTLFSWKKKKRNIYSSTCILMHFYTKFLVGGLSMLLHFNHFFLTFSWHIRVLNFLSNITRDNV